MVSEYVCEHGQLPRSCDRCEAQTEIANVRARADDLAARLAAQSEELAAARGALVKVRSFAANPLPDDPGVTEEWKACIARARAALAGPAPAGEWVAYVEPGSLGQFDSDPLLDDSIVERHGDEVMVALDSHRFSLPTARALAVALLSAAAAAKEGK